MPTAKSVMHAGPIKIESAIEFGEVYRDTITGFQGKCIGITRWITGCDQIALHGGMDKDGEKPIPAQWFDDGRLVHVPSAKPMASSGKGAAGEPPSDRVTG